MAEGLRRAMRLLHARFHLSLFEGYYRDDIHTHDDLDDQLSGNLCRCTATVPSAMPPSKLSCPVAAEVTRLKSKAEIGKSGNGETVRAS